jgi:hypothetical protein
MRESGSSAYRLSARIRDRVPGAAKKLGKYRERDGGLGEVAVIAADAQACALGSLFERSLVAVRHVLARDPEAPLA